MNTANSSKPARLVFRKVHIFAVGVALLAGSFSLVAVEYVSLRRDLASSIEVQMRIVADNSVMALQFNNRDAAIETLATLSASPDVDAVALYGSRQQRLAEYVRTGTTLKLLHLADIHNPLKYSSLHYTEIWQPLIYEGSPIGTLYVRANLNRLYDQLLRYVVTTSLVMLATLFAAAFLLNRLQRAVLSAEARAGYLANYDTVTQLPNRYSFTQQFQQLLDDTHRNNGTLALLVLDLDDFKVINDTLGHDVGDALLRGVADRLLSAVWHEDVIYRVGGDEFAMILSDPEDVRRLTMIAEEFIRVLTEPIVLNDHNLYIGVSIGASIYPQHGSDPAQLLRNADTAMYRAKSRGKNKFQLFSIEMLQKSSTRLSIENELREAIEQDQFELYYQPQVELPSRRLMGAEALIRWNHPTKGLLLPNEFIPVAEETGLIVTIGEWVLRTACQQARSWQEQRFKPIRVSVNLSARQFREEGLINTITDILYETYANPDLLELEITESVLMDDAESTVERLASLRAMDLHLAIDDFGTGYSSMTYLKRFPVERLKIDRSFVHDIPDSADDMAIVMATIQMAHSLKLEVIAEGIETEAQAKYLAELRCDIGQGYLFSKPVNSQQMTDLLRSGLPLVNV